MVTRSLFGAAGAAAVAIAAAIALASGAASAQAQETERGASADAEHRLDERIQAALREGGPFFNAEERAVIERACGYPAGSWDGFQANMSNGVFNCTNGRSADSREVRAVMRAAGPRIGRRVSETMERTEIREAIEAVAREAAATALASIDHAEIAREATQAAETATREAMEEARVEIERATEDVRRRRR
jgi:ribosomal protein L12E/L44/L45/RPP1/RPP2